MALMSAPSGGQLTAIRSDNNYHAMQFVCFVPNTVVVKFNPSVAPTASVYAEIAVGSIAAGSMSNIRAGMLVIFSTTSDHQASETFRTRVRKVSGTSILYVAENSQTLTTAHYVTVINTYQVQERLRRSETEVDWEITSRKLLPVETALPSAVVLSNGTVAYTPTGVPKAMDASASSSFTHAWESSNSSDTLNSGGTTASPNFTLQAGAFRWIRYTFTDSNGNPNYRVIAVWTVPKNYSGVVALGVGSANGAVADVSFDAELGWSATIPAFDGIETVLNKTFCVIACDEWYNGSRQSIRTNINMVGYLQTESTVTVGDPAVGRTSETRFTVEGFGHQLARQNVSAITVFATADAPAAWDFIQNPTPGRMLTYRLTEYSTILNLCALTLPPDDADFIGDDLDLTSGKALDDIRTLAEGLNAELQFDIDGRLDFCRNLNLLDDDARDAAPVAITHTLADFLSFQYDIDHSKTCSQVTMKGGAYVSSLDRYNVVEAIAPAVARESEGDPITINNLVLTTDSTDVEANEEASQYAENLFALNNPTYMVRFTYKDEFHFMLPDVGSWIKYDITGSDTVRGKVFGSSDRWQIVSISVSTNSLTGRRQVDGVARHETQSTGAMVRAAPVVADEQTETTYYPGTTLPFSGVPTGDGVFYDSRDTQPPNSPNPPDDPDCELGGLRIKSVGGYSTTRPALNGEQVSVTTRGAGQISEGILYDFAAGTQSFTGTHASYGAGVGWNDVDWGPDAFGNTHRGVTIDLTATLGIVTKIIITYDYTKGAPELPSAFESVIVLNGGFVASRTFDDFPASGTDLTWVWTGSVSAVTSLGLQVNCDQDLGNDRPGGMSGSVTIKSIQVNETIYNGDSYYFWTGPLDEAKDPTPYASGKGLLIELAQPISIPPFNPTHEYTVVEIVTSGPVLLTFESPYSLSQASNWSIQAIVCFGGVP